MANNTHKYGFRWSTAYNGGKSCPAPERWSIATGTDFTDDNANSVKLSIGDVVKIVATGDIDICEDTASPYGVVVGFEPYWDGEVMKPTSSIPNQHAWGTIEARRPWALVVPVTAGAWEADVDDNTSATTFAAYQATVGENVNHFSAGNTAAGTADPRIDISTHDQTAALDWRILAVSRTAENKDFSGTNVKLIVTANTSQRAGQAATTIAGV